MIRDDLGRIKSGNTLTQEEHLKKIESLKESWKQRKDYIGDLKIKCPPLYNIWRAFMFTEKGKKYGHSEEWGNFRTFFNDVYPSYKKGYKFRRKDIKLPFSKNNFMWVNPDKIKELNSSVYLFYNGVSKSLKEWSAYFGLNYNGIKQRYYRGKNYTTEEILFGKNKKSRGDITSINTISDEQKRRDKISKMLSAYKCKDKKKGYICNITKDYLTNIIYNSKCFYCGDTKNIGLDRIDNNRGHEIGNVVPCCYECNVARSNNFSFKEMLKLGKVIKQIKRERNEINTDKNSKET